MMSLLILLENFMAEGRPSWFAGLFGRGEGGTERAPSDVRGQDDGFKDFWEAHGSRFAALVTNKEDRGQLELVYRAYRQNPSVTFEDERAAEMLEVVKAALGGPEAPPPAAPAAALEVPPEEEERRPPAELAA